MIETYFAETESRDIIYNIGVLLLLFVGIIGLIIAQKTNNKYKKKLIRITTIPVFLMVISYIGISQNLLTVDTGATEQSTMRFIGYTAISLLIVYLFNEALNLSSKDIKIVSVLLLLYPWATFVSWITTGIISNIALGVLLFSLIVNIYYLFIKFKKYEQNSKIEELLFYRKIRNMSMFIFISLTIAAAISPQALNLTTNFISQHISIYLDMWLFTGILYLTITTNEFYQSR